MILKFTMYVNVIATFILIIITSFLEINVFNEETILLLCFIAFIVNAFCYSQISFYQALNEQSSSIKHKIIQNFATTTANSMTAIYLTGSQKQCVSTLKSVFYNNIMFKYTAKKIWRYDHLKRPV